MCLLKQETPFLWDEATQQSFESLKKALLSTPILHPSDYTKDFILYLVASKSTIGLVLVQEEGNIQEHVVYYLSYALAFRGLRYSHIKKLALETFHVV